MTIDLIHSLPQEAHRALLDGTIQGLVVAVYENEKPPCGLAGVLDWYFQGALSSCIQASAITGKVGECVYFPLSRHRNTYHLILVGAGPTLNPGHRIPFPTSTLHLLQKNLHGLKIPKLGLSSSDFGLKRSECGPILALHFKGLPLWIAH